MDRASALWPQKWAIWDVDTDDRVLCVALFQAGGGAPAFPVEEVEVRETARDVIVTFYARRGASKMARVTTAIEIVLQSPVGDRRVFDGVDGQRRFQLMREDAGTVEGSDIWACEHAMRDPRRWTKPFR